MEDSDFRSKRIGEQLEKAVRLLENNEIKSGDIVYSMKECADVIFLEKPAEKIFFQYRSQKSKGIEDVPFPGYVKYKTFTGEIKEAPIACIVKISKGNFSSEFEIKGKNAHNDSDFFEFTARGMGFRVDRKIKRSKLRKKYILTFFGDSQEEIDHFVINCCQNKLFIWD